MFDALKCQVTNPQLGINGNEPVAYEDRIHRGVKAMYLFHVQQFPLIVAKPSMLVFLALPSRVDISMVSTHLFI